jgi:multimeric flavodoxin WrbA
MVRVLGISGSPRHGNTEILVKEALAAAQSLPFEVETEFLSFAGKTVEPCTDCGACVRRKTYCWKEDDWWTLVRPLAETPPDGVIIGSPVYFFSVTSVLRAYFERCTCLMKQLWDEDFPHAPPDWTKTAAGAIAVGFHRHGGVEHALSNILDVLLTNGFVCVGGDYIGAAAWQLEQDRTDAVNEDEIGLNAARGLGRRVGYTAALLAAGKGQVPDLNLLKIG